METTRPLRTISRDVLKAKIAENKKLQLWNVLTREHFKSEENIPGSKWLPVDQLEGLLPMVNVKKDEEIIVYCGGDQCTASRRAAEWLVRQGFERVLFYEGGLKEWKKSSLPLVKVSP